MLLPSPALTALALALFALSPPAAMPRGDRRVVDVAQAGTAQSEADHGFDGALVLRGAAGGKSYWQTRSWLHFAMKTFEDTPVTIAFTFVNTGDTLRGSYELVVEDSTITKRTLAAPKDTVGATTTVELAVPFSLTKGKTHIAILVRTRGDLSPALHQLRTIQDHYEVDSWRHSTRLPQ